MSPYPIIFVFDLDNTLVHSSIDFLGIRKALADWASKKGINEVHEFQKMAISRIISRIETKFGPNSSASTQVWRIVEGFEEKGMAKATISDDVIPALQKIRDLGIKSAIFTNNSLRSAQPALEKFRLGPFDVIKARDNVSAMKPSGIGLLEIIRILSGTVEKTYFVGDSWVDGLCAQDAGIKFIVFGTERFSQIEERGIPYHTRVENMRQLSAFAEEILAKSVSLS